MIRGIVAALLLATAALAQGDYTAAVTVNPGSVYAGYRLWANTVVTFSSTPYSNIYVALTTSDPSVTATIWCGIYDPTCWGSGTYVYNTAASNNFGVVIVGTTPGSYTVTASITSNSIPHSVTIPLTVLAVPSVPVRPTITIAPALDSAVMSMFRAYAIDVSTSNIATVQSEARCDPSSPPAPGYWLQSQEAQAWYYDGAYIYYDLADFIGDANWKTCALNVATWYADYANSGIGQGWRVFSQGMRRAYAETGDIKYKNAVSALITTTPYAPPGGQMDDFYIRETAYILRANTDANLMGITTDSSIVSRSLDWLLGDINTLDSAAPASSPLVQYHQSVFDGLAAEALTYYYDNWSHDPRIPPAIKKLADWNWTYMWHDPGSSYACAESGETLCLWNNPYVAKADQPHMCDGGCQTAYTPGDFNLLVPAYWWYWRLTGDDSYRVKGDTIFYHTVDQEAYSGKEFSQFLHWSLPGLVWRNLPALGNTYSGGTLSSGTYR
jgi:hypothetical protein